MTADLIVVFKKDLKKEDAELILSQFKDIIYREGMDSSRGKAYFYSTGPKYIINMDINIKANFINQIESNPKLHEVYEADWNKLKD